MKVYLYDNNSKRIIGTTDKFLFKNHLLCKYSSTCMFYPMILIGHLLKSKPQQKNSDTSELKAISEENIKSDSEIVFG